MVHLIATRGIIITLFLFLEKNCFPTNLFMRTISHHSYTLPTPPPNPRHRSWSRSTLTLKLDQSTQKQVRTWLDPIIYFPQYLIKNGYFTLQILLDWLILLILYLLFINFFEIALFWLLKFQFYYSGICHHSVFQISFFKL